MKISNMKLLPILLVLFSGSVFAEPQLYKMSCNVFQGKHILATVSGEVILGTHTAVVKVSDETTSMPLITQSNEQLQYGSGKNQTVAFSYPNNTARIQATGVMSSGDTYECIKDLDFSKV